jgi:hydroxymethylbilane synthase
MNAPLRIGTRGSPLALWQARHVAELLRPLAGSREVALVEIETTGDQVRDRPLGQIGGEGLFTKEIQRALLDGRIDVGVHSLKDLPTLPVDGLMLGAVPLRGPSGDVLVSREGHRFDELSQGACVGSSSPRRRAQLLHRRPDLRVVDIRGNVETRLRKLHERGLDATVLAQAGLERLGLTSVITEVLDPQWMLPAVGQGALGIECRAEDSETRALLRQIEDPTTRQAVLAERSLLFALGGGCQVPLGALATVAGDTLTLRAAVVDGAGRRRVEGTVQGSAGDAEALGRQLAASLLSQGARELLS